MHPFIPIASIILQHVVTIYTPVNCKKGLTLFNGSWVIHLARKISKRVVISFFHALTSYNRNENIT